MPTQRLVYHISSHEVRDALQLLNTPDYPLEDIAERVSINTSVLDSFHKRLPNELKDKVLLEEFCGKPRDIRVVYDLDDKDWTYLCSNPANKIPFPLYGLDKFIEPLARKLYPPAPWMGLDEYPFFNPAIDTLFLEYLHCSNTVMGSMEYNRAMRTAAFFLEAHNMDQHATPVHTIKLTWCQNETDPSKILNHFRCIPNLKKIILTAHDHYTSAYEGRPELMEENHTRENYDDPQAMLEMVALGELQSSFCDEDGECKRRPYPFEVQLYDHKGRRVEA